MTRGEVDDVEDVVEIDEYQQAVTPDMLPENLTAPSPDAGSDMAGFWRSAHPYNCAHGLWDGIAGSSSNKWNNCGCAREGGRANVF